MKAYILKTGNNANLQTTKVAVNQMHAEYLAVKNNGYGKPGVFQKAKIVEIPNAEIINVSSVALPGFENDEVQTSTIVCL